MHSQVNKLLRWKQIADEVSVYLADGMPLTKIHKNHIYPKYFISKRTLTTIVGTPITKELKRFGVEVQNRSTFVRDDKPRSDNFYLQ